MTSIDNANLQPEPPIAGDPTSAPKPGRRARLGLRGSLLLGGGLLAGVVLGAGGLATAASVAGGMPGWHPGPKLERVQWVVERALDSVGATSAQEAAIHDIVAANFDAVVPPATKHDEMRKQVLDLLRAPTLDKAAIEKLRADEVATFDAKSKTLTEAIGKAAEILTPEQRAKLADRIEEMAQRAPWRHPPGPGHHRHGPGFGPMGPADGPDDGPDGPDGGPAADGPQKG